MLYYYFRVGVIMSISIYPGLTYILFDLIQENAIQIVFKFYLGKGNSVYFQKKSLYLIIS
jgi:hypothetical protein